MVLFVDLFNVIVVRCHFMSKEKYQNKYMRIHNNSMSILKKFYKKTKTNGKTFKNNAIKNKFKMLSAPYGVSSLGKICVHTFALPFLSPPSSSPVNKHTTVGSTVITIDDDSSKRARAYTH